MYVGKGNQISLALAKNRIAPIKTVTLPRLELLAAQVATQPSRLVIKAMNLATLDPPAQVSLWTDNQIVSHWLRQRNPSKPGISQRVEQIVSLFPADMWSYTPTNENHADLLTRGISAEQLTSSRLWMQGPQWLPDKQRWPKWKPVNTLHLQVADTNTTDIRPAAEEMARYQQVFTL